MQTHIRPIHFCIKSVTHQTGGCAVKSAAYMTAKKMYSDYLGTTFSYGRAHRVTMTDVMLPDYAPDEYRDIQTLFNSADSMDKKESEVCVRTIDAALPNELRGHPDLQRHLIESYIRATYKRHGYCTAWAVHDEEPAEGHEPNLHVHLVIVNRPLLKNGTWGAKQKTEYAKDENGQKIPVMVADADGNMVQKIGARGRKVFERVSVRHWLDQRDSLIEMRTVWADICNDYVNGDRQFTAQSYAEIERETGQKRIPTRHKGQWTCAREKQELHCDIVTDNQHARTYNEAQEEIENIAAELERRARAPKKPLRITDLAPLELSGPPRGGGRITVSPERQGTRDAGTFAKQIEATKSDIKQTKASDKKTRTTPRKTAQNPARHAPQVIRETPHETPQKTTKPRTETSPQTPPPVAPVVQTPPPAQTPQSPRRIGYARLVAAGERYAQTGAGLRAVLTACVQRPDLSSNNVLAVVGAAHIGAVPVVRVVERYTQTPADRPKPPRRRTVQLSPSSPLPLIPAGATDEIRTAIRAEVHTAAIHDQQSHAVTAYMVPQIRAAVVGDALDARALEHAAQIIADDCAARPDAHRVRTAVTAIVSAVRHLILTVRDRIRRRTQTQTQGQTQGQSQTRTAGKRAGKTTGQSR